MKYLCLVYAREKELGAVPDRECLANDGALQESGHCLGTRRVWTTDGPFVETKEGTSAA